MSVEPRSPNQHRKRATIRLQSRVFFDRNIMERRAKIYAAEKSRLNMDGDLLYDGPVKGNS